jgi:hypothetical protein
MAVYSLNAVEFQVETGGDGWSPGPPPPPQLRHEHNIPYSGGVVVVDRGGSTLPHWTFTMLVTAATRAGMLANLAVAPVVLVTPDGTFANCELVSLSDAKVTPVSGTRSHWSYSADIAVAP